MSDPVIAKNGPYPVQVKQGDRIFWCSCGRSRSQPGCDGSHKGSDMMPVGYKAEKDGTLYLCGCKKTKTPPFCDGTHNSL